jgi:cyclophilin family peptidyl-prolyl cis-trans isomerase
MVVVDTSSAGRRSVVHNDRRKTTLRQAVSCLQWIVGAVLTGLVVVYIFQSPQWMVEEQANQPSAHYETKTSVPIRHNHIHHQNNDAASSCPVMSVANLSDDILHPTVGSRWVVTPPNGGDLHLMCCHTTKGSLSILLHSRWAPLGVEHLLEMLSAGYFHSEIPLFRCTDACQFGLSSNTTWTKRFDKHIPDDPLWLPTGPEHRVVEGVTRYPKGVMTHAGGGPHTRSNQFVLTLKPNPFMGGGSPWEVPLGEVVGDQSFRVLEQFYNGYGEKGPSQALLRKGGVTELVKEQWPLMDYIQHCDVVDSRLATS